jgi:hypothetical protein
MRLAPVCLRLAPSPGHTSFLQQHHFQGNIQQLIRVIWFPFFCYTHQVFICVIFRRIHNNILDQKK